MTLRLLFASGPTFVFHCFYSRYHLFPLSSLTMAEIEKKVEDLSLNASADAADKAQGKPKEKKTKKHVAEGAFPLEVHRNTSNKRHIATHRRQHTLHQALRSGSRRRCDTEELCRYCCGIYCLEVENIADIPIPSDRYLVLPSANTT